MQQPRHPYDLHVGRYGPQLAARLIALAGLQRGQRALDVGCGTGQLTARLAEVAGPDCVAGIDPLEEHLEVCRARVPGADLRLASAEALPFGDGEFDAIFAQLVIQLVDDPPTAVGEMARVARPGAPIVACVWDDVDMPLVRSFWDAARTVAPEATGAVSDREQVGLRDPGILVDWWRRAGLGRVELAEFEVGADYHDFDDLWRPFAGGAGRSGGLLLSLEPATREALRDDAFRRLGSPRGAFRLSASAHSVIGFRAAGDCRSG